LLKKQNKKIMKEKFYLFPIFIRIWHFINAIAILILIVSGLSLQYSEPGRGLIPFQTSIQIHNVCGIILVLNYLIFFIGNLTTPNGKHYKLFWKSFRNELIAQAKYYLGSMFQSATTPFPINSERKFNPLQKFAYTATMYIFVPFVLITGLGLMFPEIIVVTKIFNYSSILFTDIIHIISGFVVSMFLLVHIYLCTLGIKKHNTFKSIINGWHYAD